MKFRFAVAAHLGVAGALLAAGCYGDVGPPLLLSPTHGSMFGQTRVTITGDFSSVASSNGDGVDYFTIGGNQVLDAVWSSGSVTVTTQGGPLPGPADVVIRGKGGRIIRHDVFTFDDGVAKVPLNWMAFGASLTQGTESSGIDPHTQLFGVSAQIARQAGVYLGLPLFDPNVTPPLEPTDFYPDCTQIPKTGAGVDKIAAVTTNPSTDLIDLRRARLDWTLQARDVASGGAKVNEIDHGVQDPTTAVLAHIVNDPTVDASGVFGSETTSQIDRVEALDPDVAFSTDLMANDLDSSVIQSDDLHIDLATPLAQVQPYLQEIMQRLGRLHGQFFVANMPSLTFIPNVAALRAQRIADGSDTAESFDAKVKAIDDLTASYNAALEAAAQPYANIHLVDFAGYVDSLKGGLTVGGEHLTPAKFDGLMSLDGLHLTDTGYALYANKFIDTIDATLGVTIPDVDVAAVHAQDPLTPSRLRAAGLTCVPAN
jgi:hypothetical protein